MDKLKKGRKPVRSRLTKLVNEADALLQAPAQDRNLLRIKLDLLHQTNGELQEWDDKVKVQLLDDDATDEDMEKEYDEIDGYKENYLQMKMKLETICEGPRLPSPTASEASHFSTASGFERRTINLPKIELQRFNGELKQWLGFWSQFRKIHEDHEIEGCDKLHYLQQSMIPGTIAHDIVSSYPQTSENYLKVVEVLESQFGNKTVLLQVYVRELLKLVITNVNSKEKIPLEALVLQLDSHLRSLESLELERADPATWLFPLVESSLPEDTLLTWQRSPLSEKDGSLEEPKVTRLSILMDFLKKEVAIKRQIHLAQTGFQEEPIKKNEKKKFKEEKVPTLAGFHISDSNGCIFCGKAHLSQECFTARKMGCEEKKKKISESKACFICLKKGHSSSKCRAKVMCHHCEKRHHAIMCQSFNGAEKVQQQSSGMRPESAPGSRSADWAQAKNVHFQEDGAFAGVSSERKSNLAKTGTQHTNSIPDFMGMSNQVCTAEVKLMTLMVDLTVGNRRKTVRAFIDSGSQRSYILESTAEELGIPTFGEEMATHSLFGGVKTQTVVHTKYIVPVSRNGGGFSCEMKMRGTKKICQPIPRIPRNSDLFAELKKHKIYVNDVGDYSSVIPEIEILIGGDIYGRLLTGKLVQLNHGITAQETRLGWVLSGEYSAEDPEDTVSMMVMTMTSVDAPLEELWKLETLGIRDDAESKTAAQMELEAKNKFVETISRNDDGRYRVRLPFLEDHPPLPSNKPAAIKRLETTTEKLVQQGKFDQYDSLLKEWSHEFTEEVSAADNNCGAHYIPHRPVFKESLTTPVRPVFDCSAKSGKCPSLNDCLHTGSNLIQLIPELLTRFREKKIGVTADIRKAFQMIEIQPVDRKFLRFLWWEDYTRQRMISYQHSRVVFGATCSPFILGAVLEHHLTHVSPPNNYVAIKLLNGFYVDNYLGSEDTMEEYTEFREIATDLLADAKMDLRMWLTNVDSLDDSGTLTTSILGLQWNRKEDIMFVPVSGIKRPESLTKRALLSIVQKVFDPLGFLSPALIPMKIILQKQWINKQKWEDVLPAEEEREFSEWFSQIHCLQEIKIPRLVTAGEKDRSTWSLHCFTDASSLAFACVIFLRVQTTEGVSVQLLLSKARVAPVKRMTIPRLELMGCLVGSRLAKTVKKALNLEEIDEFYWSDSTTALAWIKRNYNHQVFVRNRVKEIREKTKCGDWRHVPGIMNPADLPSRGCSPRELLLSKWWEGPAWLRLPQQQWPSVEEEENENEILAEVKKEEPARVIAACFLDGARKEYTFAQQLTHEELRAAELVVLKEVQDEYFHDLDCLKGLPTFRGDDGLLRVKTRLLNRDDLADFKTPIVLPSKHPVVSKIIAEVHQNHCHGGVNFLMAHLREKYWILQARRTIKTVLNSCHRCRRYAAKPAVVEEAPLPEDRIRNAQPFEIAGVDLAGPLLLKNKQKAWIVLYTCAVYRAVFLDVVTSLSTQAFIKSLSRFVEKHGRPSVIYSDNGTNFVGANNKFKELDWNKITADEDIAPIQWKFNPPAAPWWGGWWERLIRSVKDLLRKTLGKAVVSLAEIKKLLRKVEEVMNNRPLTYVSEHPSDLEPLTPAMFLRAPMRTRFPEGETEKANLQRRQKYIVTLEEELKQRFRSEYLALLISRPKKLTRELMPGEIVFVGSELRKRMHWQLGRILEFLPGKDKVGRLAVVKTKDNLMKIPVQRLHPLELDAKMVGGSTRFGRKLTEPERLGIDD